MKKKKRSDNSIIKDVIEIPPIFFSQRDCTEKTMVFTKRKKRPVTELLGNKETTKQKAVAVSGSVHFNMHIYYRLA